jgi:signal transduction histidine kinase
MDERNLRSYFDSATPPIVLDDYQRIERVARVVVGLVLISALLLFQGRFEHASVILPLVAMLSGTIIVHAFARPRASVFENLVLDTTVFLLMTIVIDAPELAVFAAVAQTFMLFHFVPPRQAVGATIGLLGGGLAAAAVSLMVENQHRSPSEVLRLLVIVTVLTTIPAIVLQIMAGAEVHRHRVKEEQLARDKDALLAEKSRFVASVSHELRTPLTAVVGLAHTLADPDSDLADVERDEFLKMLVDQSEDVAAIVDDLLVAARVGSGQLELVIREVDLSVEVETVAPEGTAIEGSSHDTVLAYGDPIRVRQILRNLLTNARRYGGPNLRVRLGADESRATVAIEDDGEEIPPERVDEIFAAYGRAHDRPDDTDSVGLGLTVSRELARMMGGDIEYSHTDGWSSFVFSLPLDPIGGETASGPDTP